MTKKPKSDDRIHVALTPSIRTQVQILKEKTDARSVSAVLRDALKVYLLVYEAQNNGSDFLIRSKTGEIEQVRLLF